MEARRRIRIPPFAGVLAALAVPAVAAAPKIREFRVPTAKSRPITIAAGPKKTLWFAEFTGNKIGRINLKGKVREFRVPTPKSSPGQVTRGPDGAMWFTEMRADKVGRIAVERARR